MDTSLSLPTKSPDMLIGTTHIGLHHPLLQWKEELLQSYCYPFHSVLFFHLNQGVPVH